MTKLLDPVCDMVVSVEEQREHGLTLDMPDRTYAFCAAGCLATFAKSPNAYRAKVDAWLAAGDHAHADTQTASDGTPVIDAGMRAWYKACRCCLSDAHPDVVQELDAEAAAKAPDPHSRTA